MLHHTTSIHGLLVVCVVQIPFFLRRAERQCTWFLKPGKTYILQENPYIYLVTSTIYFFCVGVVVSDHLIVCAFSNSLDLASR
jgi:hypothetical protein